jgi:hypothetical protein
MRVVTYDEVPWTRNNGLRGGTPTGTPGASKGSSLHRRLLRGTPGAPGNFEAIVLWSQQSDEGSSRTFPRHRHTFDQVRLTLSGTPEWVPGVATPPGAISYVPAGTWYAPSQRDAGHAQLHIQFEGANRYPFTDYSSLILARDRLAERGTFEGGRYWWVDENGTRHSKDGFEAGQEEATGRRPEFPLPRYTTPINIEPENFAWIETEPGVQLKELGRFSERQTRIAMLRLDGSAVYQIPVPEQTTLLFVTSGSGAADGQAVGERDSMLLEPGETGTVSTTSELALFILGFPVQDQPGTTEAGSATSSGVPEAATVPG